LTCREQKNTELALKRETERGCIKIVDSMNRGVRLSGNCFAKIVKGLSKERVDDR